MGGSGGEGSMMNCEGARVKVKELWGRVEEGEGWRRGKGNVDGRRPCLLRVGPW